MDNPNLSALEKQLDYQFKDKECLQQALRHSSYINERTDEQLDDNERFEFLGDAVLSLVIGHILMIRQPDLQEGDLSRIRANLVNEARLAALARNLKLGEYILLGKGEIQSQGGGKNSILANTFEAIVAAIYLDGGFAVVFKIINNLFADLIDVIHTPRFDRDYKSRLQEYMQSSTQAVPEYHVVQATGPDHDKTFIVALKCGDLQTEGRGKSKKTAEQDAACKALDKLTPVAG